MHFLFRCYLTPETNANEIPVERARPMRANVGPAEAEMFTESNERALAFDQG